jgi:glycosyltransferase involved in cell wall biosynthesis
VRIHFEESARPAMPERTPRAPRVSIVIPVYNGSNYLREAIDSALAQTYSAIEVLVVNDGSTDGGATEAIARSYGERIRYLAKENGGVASALNLGLREMTGEYFAWLSHDDVYLPHRIAAQMARVRECAGEAVLFADYAIVDAHGRRLGERRYRGHPEAIRIELVVEDPVNGCTVLVPRRCFDVVGEFDARLRTIQDYDMWFRLAERFPFVHVPEVVLLSRHHAAQGIRTISSHHAETSRELTRFLRLLRPDEIGRAHPGPPWSFYTWAAFRMKLRGYDQVAAAALDCARRHRAGVRSAVEITAVAAACLVLTRKMKPAYWLAAMRAVLRPPDSRG